MIREFRPEDVEELKRIHRLYFEHEFYLPDFLKYMCAFVVEDDQGIITMGGIRSIAECVAVTNMGRKPLDRAQALYKLLDASVFVARNSGYDQIYVWSRNPKYTNRLIKTGFGLSDGQSLILDL